MSSYPPISLFDLLSPPNRNVDPFKNDVDKAFSSFFSAFNGVAAAGVISSLVSSVVLVIAATVVIYAIINCVRKYENYIPISGDVTSRTSGNYIPLSSSEVAFGSKAQFPTVKEFLSDMEREKPVAYTAKQIAEYTQNYSYSNILGSGGFGVVYKGFLENGVTVAVKVLTNNRGKMVEKQFMAEVGTLGRTYHVNLVRLVGFCFVPEMKALVYEYMENGSLEKLLFKNDGEVDLEKLHGIAVQTAKGLAYLHEECERKIIHYDIKPENVLLDENLNPKVADFGLAKLCNRGSSQVILTNFRGTAGYAAPELWKPYPVTHKCDVYSFGILLFEIVERRRHYDDNVSHESRDWLPKWTWNMFEKNELATLLLRCGIEESDREKAERMLLIALWCIQYSPEARPLMSNVVQMLEGNKEISPPPFPFEHLQSPRLNSGQNSGTDDDTSLSASGTLTDPRCDALEIEVVLE
ncbi:hypothetical protein ACLB2K_042326 [Fragaria x ananassa]